MSATVANVPLSTRTQRAASKSGRRRHGWYHDRVVRFLHIRYRRRPDLSTFVLSQSRSSYWYSGGVQHLLYRICRPADRRGDLWSLRRSHRPQGDFDLHAARHGHRDIPDRFRSDLCSIGIWGAVILTLLRTLQGIGVGGEWGGSVLIAMEWSRGHHSRGLVASWPQFGVPSGLFLANLAILGFSAWTGPDFATWGWRVPFGLSFILIGIGCGSGRAFWRRQCSSN